jgi:hypothetical protein
MRIDFFHAGGERTATTKGNAEIVNGIGRWVGAQFRQFFQRPLHPERKVTVLLKSTRGNGNSESHVAKIRFVRNPGFGRCRAEM